MERPEVRLVPLHPASFRVPTVDVGLPLLAMHSSRELMGVKDLDALTDMIRAYYTL